MAIDSSSTMNSSGAMTRFRRRRSRHLSESFITAILMICTAVTIFTTVGIVAILLTEGLSFFSEIKPQDFFFGTRWTPLFPSAGFGVLPLICGTLLIALGASLISLPLGTLAAIYLSEYAKPTIRNILKPILEVLAGVPTIVYGYFALTWITPLLFSLTSEYSMHYLQ